MSSHKRLIGDVATMVTGRAVAATIALVTMPIIARLYEPGDFGVAAVFLSLVGLISTVASLRFDVAIPLPKNEGHAVTIAAVAVLTIVLFCLGLLVLMGSVLWIGPDIRFVELLGSWYWFLPIAVLLASLLHVQESWLTRLRGFGVISTSLVAGSIANSGTRIGVATLIGSSVQGLIGGSLTGMSLRLIIQNWRHGVFRSKMARRVSWARMRASARRFSDFPLLNAPAAVVFAVGQNLPVLLLGMMFSAEVAGFYAMADRLSRTPITIVTNSVRRVFLKRAADIRNFGGNMRKEFLFVVGSLVVIGLIPFWVVWEFGQTMLTFLLGANWVDAGRYLEIMSPWLFVAWISAPTNAVFIVLRKQRLWLGTQATITTLKALVFALAFVLSASAEVTLASFVALVVFGNLSIIAITILLASQHDNVTSK